MMSGDFGVGELVLASARPSSESVEFCACPSESDLQLFVVTWIARGLRAQTHSSNRCFKRWVRAVAFQTEFRVSDLLDVVDYGLKRTRERTVAPTDVASTIPEHWHNAARL